jgi:thioredoxin reductase (NADPH)
VGGGNSAAEEAVFLSRFASHVTIVTRGKELTASQLAQRKLDENPKIDVRYGSVVEEFRGRQKLDGVVLRDVDSGATEEVHVAAAFLFIGLQPNTEFVRGSVALDDSGFFETSATLETSVPGVFAAGDARAGSTKQLVSAAGEGATAALMIRDYLRRAKEARSTAREIERDATAV